MTCTNKAKLPQKEVGTILKEIYKKHRTQSKASPALLEILKQQKNAEQADIEKKKKSAKKSDLDI